MSLRLPILSIALASTLAVVSGCHDGKPAPASQAGQQPSLATVPTTPKLTMSATTPDAQTVVFTVTTNLPLPVAAMASLDLQGLKPQDPAIGTSRKVTLDRPKTTFSLKAINDVAVDAKPLPKGKYDANVMIGPKWEENKAIASLSGPLSVTETVELKLGGSQAVVKRQGELQRWVMTHVDADTPWNEALYVKQLGKYKKQPSDLSPMHVAYYFPDADMTLLVNRVQQRISTWRIGRATR